MLSPTINIHFVLGTNWTILLKVWCYQENV
jgi:hypothetical protein